MTRRETTTTSVSSLSRRGTSEFMILPELSYSLRSNLQIHLELPVVSCTVKPQDEEIWSRNISQVDDYLKPTLN